MRVKQQALAIDKNNSFKKIPFNFLLSKELARKKILTFTKYFA